MSWLFFATQCSLIYHFKAIVLISSAACTLSTSCMQSQLTPFCVTFSVKCLFFWFRHFYYCSYISIILHACCKWNWITFLFLWFFLFDEKKTTYYDKKANFWTSLSLFPFWRLRIVSFTIEISWLCFKFAFVYEVRVNYQNVKKNYFP